MVDLDERIRNRAYEIWKREGCPEGQHEAHWLRAREEVLSELDEADAQSVPQDPPKDVVEADAKSKAARGRKTAAPEATAVQASNPATRPSRKSKTAAAETATADAGAGEMKPKRARKGGG